MIIKALIIDLEGVILNIDYSRTFAEFKKLGIHISYDQQFQKMVNDYDSGKISTEEFFLQFKSTYDSSGKLLYDDFVYAWNAMLLDIYDQNIEFLFKLKSQGYILILLSNINELHANNVLQSYGNLFEKLFSKIYFSYKTKILKPDKAAFNDPLLYLAQYGITRNQVMFVDDSTANIRAAKEFLLQGLLYPQNGSGKTYNTYLGGVLISLSCCGLFKNKMASADMNSVNYEVFSYSHK